MSLRATAFTELVGCAVPLQQAAMGGVTTVELAAAVAAEGGLGMLSGTGRTASDLVADFEAASALAGPGGVVGASFIVPFLDRGALEAIAATAPLVECFYGDPDDHLVAAIHAGGALAAWQVGSTAEAAAAVDAGVDIVVAQGREAGGHVRGSTGLLPLLDEVLHVVDVPVVAAGGLGSGRAIAAVLTAGAHAVRIGTRFVATVEADVHPDYAAALVEATAGDTVLTDTFSLAWPDAPHRVLRSCVDASGADKATRSPMPPGRTFDGPRASAALYAGESVGSVHAVRPAADVFRELVADAVATLG